MARNKPQVKLQDSDWDALFPGEDYTIGSTTFKIVPLSVEDLSIVLKRISTITNQLATLEMQVKDFAEGEESRPVDSGERILRLVQLIVEEAPDILSQMSGLDVEDIKGLPITAAVDLFNKVLDVNIKSQDDLVKNFKGLADRFKKFTSPTVEQEQTMERAKLQ